MNDIKVLEALDKLLPEQTDVEHENLELEKASNGAEFGVLDNANVMLVAVKSPSLNAFMRGKYKLSKVPELKDDAQQTGKFSFEYLEHIVRILKKADG